MGIKINIATAAQGCLPSAYRRQRSIRLTTSRPLVSTKARPTSSISKESLVDKRPAYVPNEISDPNYVRIFDTTLRDGEQSPGASLSGKEKLSIARQLAKLRVDIIEAGFPRTSPADFEAVKSIAEEIGQEVSLDGYSPVICGLSRANVDDIDASWNAVKHARRPRIHTFIGTSPIHMEAKLKKSPEEVVKTAIQAVTYARSLGCSDIEFSPEDAGRSNPEFLYYILGEVIKAGATTINIPDTVGYNIPQEYGRLIRNIRENTPGVDNVVISTHCQNDLGLATANTLAGAMAGARQMEVTINGIGERAGNASLEEVVMAIKMRGGGVMGGLWTGLDVATIGPISKMVSEYTGMAVQPHKAIVGANAFAHESGIHQDGMLKNKSTYEIMSPEDLGLIRKDNVGLVIGKHSGRHALKSRMQELGYELTTDEVNDLFKRFKELADRKKTITDDDLIALVDDEMFNAEEHWKLCDLQVVAGTTSLQNAVVSMIGPDSVSRIQSAMGTGPVDAAYKAIDKIVQLDVQLVEYGMSAVTEGIDALAQTRVMIRKNGKSFIGKSAENDIVVSSAKAYVSALNKFIATAGGVSKDVQDNGRENGKAMA